MVTVILYIQLILQGTRAPLKISFLGRHKGEWTFLSGILKGQECLRSDRLQGLNGFQRCPLEFLPLFPTQGPDF